MRQIVLALWLGVFPLVTALAQEGGLPLVGRRVEKWQLAEYLGRDCPSGNIFNWNCREILRAVQKIDPEGLPDYKVRIGIQGDPTIGARLGSYVDPLLERNCRLGVPVKVIGIDPSSRKILEITRVFDRGDKCLYRFPDVSKPVFVLAPGKIPPSQVASTPPAVEKVAPDSSRTQPQVSFAGTVPGSSSNLERPTQKKDTLARTQIRPDTNTKSVTSALSPRDTTKESLSRPKGTVRRVEVENKPAAASEVTIHRPKEKPTLSRGKESRNQAEDSLRARENALPTFTARLVYGEDDFDPSGSLPFAVQTLARTKEDAVAMLRECKDENSTPREMYATCGTLLLALQRKGVAKGITVSGLADYYETLEVVVCPARMHLLSLHPDRTINWEGWNRYARSKDGLVEMCLRERGTRKFVSSLYCINPPTTSDLTLRTPAEIAADTTPKPQPRVDNVTIKVHGDSAEINAPGVKVTVKDSATLNLPNPSKVGVGIQKPKRDTTIAATPDQFPTIGKGRNWQKDAGIALGVLGAAVGSYFIACHNHFVVCEKDKVIRINLPVNPPNNRVLRLLAGW